LSDKLTRIDILKSVEVLCYSFCIHLLIEEQLAITAAKASLLDLYGDDEFWRLEGKARENRVRSSAITRSIEILNYRKTKGLSSKLLS
jgi:hypothetical protein